jgi:Zn-dependent M28 family amino/carboxypeptidase
MNPDELKVLATTLRNDVYALADQIGERNMFKREKLAESEEWIHKRLHQSGLIPEKQIYRLQGGQFHGQEAVNLITELTGTKHPDKILVIGAHFDSVYGSPGANDNASAVAVLLALVEYFKEKPQPLTVRFLFFTNEEPPFFHTHRMGSYAYASECRQKNEIITAMIALDGLGYFSDKPGSQHYPVPGLGFKFSDKADFIGFVTRFKDKTLLNRVTSAFTVRELIPIESATLPGFIPGVYWSDHWSFWKHGYPAILVTDTLIFRDPEYHTSGDTPERLDFKNMALITEGMKDVITELGNG